METTKKTHTPNQTKVKVICYYSHRKDCTPFTHAEILTKRNRRAHDIYEYINTSQGKTITREDLSIKKALRHIELHRAKIFSALIIINSWKQGKEFTIYKFSRTTGEQFVPPIFGPDNYGGIIITGFQGEPLRSDEIRPFLTIPNNQYQNMQL